MNDKHPSDSLSDFERAEVYKKLYEETRKSRTGVMITFSVLSFTVGYLLAKLIYTHHHISFFF